MAKKKTSTKKREGSQDSTDSQDRRAKTLSKFQSFEAPTPAAADVPPPADFVPVLPSVVTAASGHVITIEAPPIIAPVAAPASEDLVPLHLLQSLPTQPMVNVGSIAVASGLTEAVGGLIKEPEPPKTIVRVTVEGAPPPMPAELLALL